MSHAARLSDLGRRVRAAAFGASTVVRVAHKKRMHRSLRWDGVKLLARELPRSRPNFSLLFKYLAANSPHRVALVAPGSEVTGVGAGGSVAERAYSFFELNDLIDRVIVGLERRDVGRRPSVLIMTKNRPEFLIAQYGMGRMGGAAVSLSWRSTAPEIEYVANHSEARALFFDAELADAVRGALPNLPSIPRERAIAVGGRVEGFPSFEELVAERGETLDRSRDGRVVMYTSGTTGKPKGAVRSFQRDAGVNALAFLGQTPLAMNETHLAVCPLYHATAFAFVGLSFMLGHSVVILPEFRPEAFLEAVRRYRATSTALVPTMLHRLLELGPERIRAADTSSLKAIFTAGAPLPGPLAADTMKAFGDKLYNMYGATETGLVSLAGPQDLRASPGTIGRALPGVETRLVDERGEECRGDAVGELFVRSSMTIDGYHADPDATRAATRDGFFSVGDLARRDARGCLHIEGRKRDMIISGGTNVYPAEIEEVLHAHPDVADAAVVGILDPEWGERVRAFVVRRPGASCDADTLKAHCKRSLAGAKVPREIVFLDALPRNPTGKVLKRELREMGNRS